jgi:two-component system CheB/CheR fusion protein
MGRLDGVRVLVVEDIQDISEVFTLVLATEGAVVTAASSAGEAAEGAKKREFDVLVTDLGLPDMARDLLIRHVTATARRRPRVVVVTGYGEPFIERARQAGADLVLPKPLATMYLIDRLVSLLATRGVS